MIRVAVLSPSVELGGAERSLLTFLKVAHGRTVEATVITPRKGPLCALLSGLRVPFVSVPMPEALLSQSRRMSIGSIAGTVSLGYGLPVYLSQLIRAIRRIAPDVIYTNGIKCHVIGALVRPVLRIPTAWHVRDHWGGWLVGRIADRGTDLVISNSRATAAALRKSMGMPWKVLVVYNAVDTEEFSPEGPAADVGSASQESPRIGLPAAFVRIKGHEILLRAAARVLTEHPSARFFFIGGTIYDTVGDRGHEAHLRRSVQERRLNDSVIFTGFQESMAPWYRAMDIIVNTTTVPEGFGRTLLEGMACGRAVVGPRAGGIPEFLRHRENGLLYEMGNAEALAEAILTLLRDPELRQELGAAGRRTAVQRFGLAPHARAVSQVLHDAAKGARVRLPDQRPQCLGA